MANVTKLGGTLDFGKMTEEQIEAFAIAFPQFKDKVEEARKTYQVQQQAGVLRSILGGVNACLNIFDKGKELLGDKFNLDKESLTAQKAEIEAFAAANQINLALPVRGAGGGGGSNGGGSANPNYDSEAKKFANLKWLYGGGPGTRDKHPDIYADIPEGSHAYDKAPAEAQEFMRSKGLVW